MMLAAEKYAEKLNQDGWDVILDDRDERPGVKFKDADLVGIPIGRLDGDYRFSFLLPLRAEMLRKVPLV